MGSNSFKNICWTVGVGVFVSLLVQTSSAQTRTTDTASTISGSSVEKISTDTKLTTERASLLRRVRPKLNILGYNNPNGGIGLRQQVRVEPPKTRIISPEISTLSKYTQSTALVTPATATVKVLAVQMSSNGSPIGGRLRYSIAEPNGQGEVDPQSFVAMFSDVNMVAGAEETVTLGTGGQFFTLESRTAPPYQMLMRSNDQLRSMILVDGMQLGAVAASKRVQTAFGGQLTIPEVISGFYDSNTDTIINLGPSRALYLFELGSLNSSTGGCDDEHCDFQDVVLLVTTNGGINEGETVEFDWIGPDDDLTFDMGGAASYEDVVGYATPGTVFTLNEERRIKEIRSVVWGTPNGPQPPPLQSFIYHLYFWNSVEAYMTGNGDPDSATLHFGIGFPTNDQPMPGPPCNGQIQYLCPWSFNWTGSAWVPTYNFQWNLIERLPEPVLLTPGEWVASIIAETGGGSNLWSVFSNGVGAVPTGVWSSTSGGNPANWNYNHQFGSGNPYPDNWGTYLSTVQP